MQKSQPPKRKTSTKQVSADAEKHPNREAAKILYINTSIGLEQIAADLGVSNQTITQWKTEDNWDEERRINNLTPGNLVQRLYHQSDDIIATAESDGRNLSAKECEAVLKISKAITQLSNGLNPSTLMQVFMKLNNYIVEVDVELTRKLIPFEKELIQHELNKQS